MLNYDDVKQIHIELSSYCNSACPSCPRNVDGGIVHPELVLHSMSLDDFKKILSTDLLKQLEFINICGNYGDPIMCKDMLDIVRYIKENNNGIRLAIHTNGGVRSIKFWTDLGNILFTMPNANVIFAIDGLEDTNHLYRIGVNWTRLMDNVKAFIQAGGPAIWDFLIFNHNEHQIEEAKNLAKKLGFKKLFNSPAHGFNYNGKMRVVDKNGKFLRTISPSARSARPANSNVFDSIDYNITVDDINHRYSQVRESVINKNHNYYHLQQEKFSSTDSIEIKNCMAIQYSEI